MFPGVSLLNLIVCCQLVCVPAVVPLCLFHRLCSPLLEDSPASVFVEPRSFALYLRSFLCELLTSVFPFLLLIKKFPHFFSDVVWIQTSLCCLPDKDGQTLCRVLSSQTSEVCCSTQSWRDRDVLTAWYSPMVEPRLWTKLFQVRFLALSYR